MEDLLEYCTDLVDQDGQLEESFDFDNLSQAQSKFQSLIENELSGYFVQVWHRVTENDPICLIQTEII